MLKRFPIVAREQPKGTIVRSRYARDVRFHTLSLRGTLVNSKQLNEAVSERPTPTQTIVHFRLA